MAKMKIFNSLEEAEFESPPKFNSIERKHFFATSIVINELLENLRTPTNKVCFLVALGYFKARRRFFYRKFMPADIEFVANQLGVNLMRGEFKQTTQKFHRILGSVTLLCSHQMILFEPIM
jgi:hypothetical protein